MYRSLTIALIIFPFIVFNSSVFGQDRTQIEERGEPILSEEAIKAGIEGYAKVLVKIDKTGKVKKAQIFGGLMWPCDANPEKELKIVRTRIVDKIKSTRFSPNNKNGKVEEAEFVVTFNTGESYKLGLGISDADDEVGTINGKALFLPRPVMPEAAKINRYSGQVAVSILIAEDGRVEKAGAYDGPDVFYSASRTAACKAVFAPTELDRQFVKVYGVLTYNFLK